jgi:selenocysteine lyase/cysteine desulfurase
LLFGWHKIHAFSPSFQSIFKIDGRGEVNEYFLLKVRTFLCFKSFIGSELQFMLDLSFVRSQFPSLQSGYTFMDNAGGSQVPQQVVDRISEYLTSYNVQLGASYEISATAGKKLQSVTARLADYIHASRPEEVVIGPSTTMLLRILSMLLSRQWQPGDEVIVTNSDHEANVSCWMDLQRYGIQVKIWRLHPETLQFELDDLRALLTNRTRLVAMVHASNILGHD